MAQRHNCHEYREDCPGCQIALTDRQGRPLPPNDPFAIAAKKVWVEATLEEKRACHRIWVFNSRAPADLAVMKIIVKRIEGAMPKPC
jgi:hypothetical protein